MLEKNTLGEYLKSLKLFSIGGRCLYFNTEIERCNEIINAHSIQKSGMLKEISIDGYVYGINTHFGNTIKNKGKLSFKRIGIKEISTFRGFCKKHDNELFEIIDNNLFEPNIIQCFLYAYRSLCREFYLKENAAIIYKKAIEIEKNQTTIDQLKNLIIGNEIGYEILKLHKEKFDKCLIENNFNEIECCCFNFHKKPNIAFSGISYPDFDFLGNKLQDILGNDFLHMITFCSAPTENGWSYVFTWHKSSHEVAESFLRSLATIAYEGAGVEDHLFRLIFTCDNFAINPTWWENLSSKRANEILEYSSYINGLLCPIEPDYLSKGLEGIVDWKFEGYNQSYE